MNQKKIVWAMLAAFMLVACSAPQQLNTEHGSMEGTIYAIGNDPFSKLGLKSKDGKMYILKCSKDLEKELFSRQGKILQVHYESREQTPEGFTLKIIKYEYPHTPQ